jgi:hypothetical protein
MSKYYIGDEIFFIPMQQETIIIKIMPKGEAGLKEDYYTVECDDKKAYTVKALKPIIKALRQDEKLNECIGCKWFVNMDGRKAFCFHSNELVRTYIEMNIRPKGCFKDTEKEKQILEGVEDEKKSTNTKRRFHK